MQIFDNITQFVKDDLKKSIFPGTKGAVAASCFSIYAYNELKKELESIDSLRFLFTSPTFITDHAPKEKREFYIPRQVRENTLCGSDYELKLRNQLTQKAIAKECAEWIREKVQFKSNISSEFIQGFFYVGKNETQAAYSPLQGFTTIDLGCERGNNVFNIIAKFEMNESNRFINFFDTLWNDETRTQDVTDIVIDNLALHTERILQNLFII